MPAAVHALLVVRPDGRAAASHLRRTIAALHAQTRLPSALTIVICGPDAEVAEIASASGAEGVITAGRSTSYAAAIDMAGVRLSGDAVWLLAQDTAPHPDALAHLAATLESAPSVGIVAPKLVAWDAPAEIVSLGLSITRYGRTVPLVDGELDQGQHDGAADVLGADIRGMLLRTETWRALDGIDPGLGGGDEGLDLGIRARLAGVRVSMSPRAIVAVAGDGVAAPPAGARGTARRRRTFSARMAQLHRRLAYAPAAAVPLHWLSLLPLALWRTVLRLLAKTPSRVGPEWAAAFLAMFRFGTVARARRRIARTRRVPWSRLAGLRTTSEQLRTRLESDATELVPIGAVRRGDLRFFSGGGAWIVLGALAVSLLAFPMLLAWPGIGGGALEPLRTTVAQLWADAGYGVRQIGFDVIGPADPFAAVIAVLGSLWPFEPSRVMLWLWLLALPLAVLGGWFAATRLTERSLLRITGAVAWGLAPTFLAALVDPRPAAVIAHLLLPWLFFTAVVAHRSWAAAGAASILFAGVIACAPSLAPALVVLWVIAIVLVAVARSGRGVPRVIWVVVPALALAAPLIWRQATTGQAWALLADPGPVWAGPQAAADTAGRLSLAAGFPTADPGGWISFLHLHWGVDIPAWPVAVLVAPLLVLAVVAPLTRRWAAGIALVGVAVAGIATAFAAVAIAVSFSGEVAVAIWPGAALSLAWIGIVGAAVVTLDAGFRAHDLAGRRIVSTVVLVTSCLLAVPMLSAVDRDAADRDTASLAIGGASTLPAYVAAEAGGDTPVATLVVTPLASGAVSVDVVWGSSTTLGSASTLVSTKRWPWADDADLAALAVDAVSPVSTDAIEQLTERGVRFVLLAPAADTADARSMRLGAVTALDQRAELDAVGETQRGTLWRVIAEPSAQPNPGGVATTVGRIITVGQLAVFGIALLLAFPTSATRRAARYTPRVVGGSETSA